MEFEWDDNKRLKNIERHGLDFLDVWQLFDGDYIKGPAKLGEGGEERFLITGMIHGLYVTGVFTMRGTVTRVISLRRARNNERREHEEIHGS
ncbi:putative cytosolic protein (plasmid) [Roseomonas mucosa]|uniref:BrnT family toxin n=1 Tax=Roseomonas TaxID=125216 RepID=UPI000C19D445|nr:MULTISPECIES: BrnT family toxin [Roseomonas]ATR19138.1 hypothetical protein CTJ15_01775 [Roseomonas sp. FDAARGOS_362]UZO99344.1 putative cytosolic protein [Roseomonas mucosa]